MKTSTLENISKFKGISGERITFDALWINLSGFIGLLIAFGISIAVSIKHKLHWINPIISFLIAFSLLILWNLLKIKTPWTYLKYIFIGIGYFFQESIWFFVINGSIILTFGLFLFFGKKVIAFIDS
jgi:hypothetical protein